MASSSWHDRAACRGMDVESFYATEERAIRAALAVCARCSVRAACLDHAMTHGEVFGVWGGTEEHERRRALRRRRPAAAQARSDIQRAGRDSDAA